MEIKNKIPISEIFPAIQGEGKYTGEPTLFVRVFGCNMYPRCSWCDSPYSWDGDKVTKTIDELVVDINKYNLESITLTGGEPMLYFEQIHELMGKLPTKKFHMETNGIIYDERQENMTHISVSLKRQAMGQSYPLSSDKLSRLPNTTFKFVYEDRNNLWWEEVVSKINLSSDRVYIMPEGKTREEQLKKMPEVLEYCLEKGYKFSPRLQVLAYDTKRGV